MKKTPSVNQRGIGKGLDAFSTEKTPVKFLILDDGWQNAQNDHKYEFADAENVLHNYEMKSQVEDTL